VRIIGIDFGERHIGVAAADSQLRIAIPLETIEVRSDPVAEVLKVIGEQGAGEVVVGIPLSLTGAEGPQASRIREVVGALSERLAIPVRLQDERFTTSQASRPPAGGKHRRRPTGNEDAIAASLILQAYLDTNR
jgi:putative Holliday junction resolvase